MLFTQDEDFLRLASGIDHSGIIYAPRTASVRATIAGLMLAWQVLDAGEMRNHIEWL